MEEIRNKNIEIAKMMSKEFTRAELINYDTDMNSLMEVVDFITKLPVKDTEYNSDYNVVSDIFGCYIETTGYNQKNIVQIDDVDRRKSLFESVYVFAKKYNNGEL